MLVTAGAHLMNYLKETAVFLKSESLLALPVWGLLMRG
jgi:hypothetical protein